MEDVESSKACKIVADEKNFLGLDLQYIPEQQSTVLIKAKVKPPKIRGRNNNKIETAPTADVDPAPKKPL